MKAEIEGGSAVRARSSASWVKRPSNNRRFFTHRYVGYTYGALGGWVIRLNVGELDMDCGCILYMETCN